MGATAQFLQTGISPPTNAGAAISAALAKNVIEATMIEFSWKHWAVYGLPSLIIGIVVTRLMVPEPQPTKPTKPTAYTVETQCNKGLLEVRLKENNEGFTKWFAAKNVQCEVLESKPLDPKEALRVKLQTPGTCPAHCICPTTKQLDVCLVTRGMCEQDRAYYKNISEGKAGCGQVFDCMDSLRESREVITRGQELLNDCTRLTDKYAALVERYSKI
jgi:hypothetical protein